MVYSKQLIIKTEGYCHIVKVTEHVKDLLRAHPVRNGIATVFSRGSTCGITIVEYEEGVLKDLQYVLEKIAPEDNHYEHDRLQGDGNGFSHVRSALMKPSISVPVVDGELVLGTWQEIVFIDFDNRNRDRELIVQIVGE